MSTMPTERYLHHVTLTTGHVLVTPRSDMRDGIAEMIRPVLEAGSGDLGGIPVRVLRREADMAALSIGLPMAVLMTVCWGDPAASQALWSDIGAKRRGAPSGDQAPAVPWLAVSLDLLVLAMLPQDTQSMLGDLERCIAWTLIDGARQ